MFFTKRSRSNIRTQAQKNKLQQYLVELDSPLLKGSPFGQCFQYLRSFFIISLLFCAYNSFRRFFVTKSSLKEKERFSNSSLIALNSGLFSSSSYSLVERDYYSSRLRDIVKPRNRLLGRLCTRVLRQVLQLLTLVLFRV